MYFRSHFRSFFKRLRKPSVAIVIAVSVFACKTNQAPLQEPNPIILTLGERSLHWQDFETFLRLSLHRLSEEDEESYSLRLNVAQWLNHQLLLGAALKEGIVVDEASYEDWIHWVTHGLSAAELADTLGAKGLSIEIWKNFERERLLTHKWAEAQWPFPQKNIEHHARKYYQDHLAEFSHPEEVKIRHLVTDSEEKAEDLRKRIVAGENFAELAIEHSLSPDRLNGGELGPFAKGELPEIFDTTCFNLPIGAISAVAKSDYGYHICKVLERRKHRIDPFQKVVTRIVRDLEDEWLAKNIEEWLKPRRKAYEETLDWTTLHNEFNRYIEKTGNAH